jgi:hypothetical protein
MEPISMILGALVMGMSAVAKEVGGQAIKDAYNGLKRLITDRYKRGSGVAALEEDPSSETQKKALEEGLQKAVPTQGPEVLQEAMEKAKSLSQALAQVPSSALEAVGVRIAELEALNARFGDIEVTGTSGTGLDIGKAKVQGDFTLGNVKVRGPN